MCFEWYGFESEEGRKEGRNSTKIAATLRDFRDFFSSRVVASLTYHTPSTPMCNDEKQRYEILFEEKEKRRIERKLFVITKHLCEGLGNLQ